MEQLLALDNCKEDSVDRSILGSWIGPVVTQINLANHKRLIRWLIQGFSEGFRIGYSWQGTVNLKSSGRNMLSAGSHKDVVCTHLKGELQEGRVACCGPMGMAKELNIPVSPFGIIPKKGRPNQWKLILDLSAPENHSVNDGIPKNWCSLQYLDVVEQIVHLGPVALLGKMEAYRNIPVSPNDIRLLSMQWEGNIYVDKVLPFGLCSAPIIFTVVADGLQWIMLQDGASWRLIDLTCT